MTDTPNTGAALDLAAFARPVPPVRFTNGSEYPIATLSAEGWALHRQMEQTDDDGERGRLAMQILRLAVPGATDADWGTLDEEGRMAAAIVGAATHRLRAVMAVMGNADAATETAGHRSRRSRRTTPSATS